MFDKIRAKIAAHLGKDSQSKDSQSEQKQDLIEFSIDSDIPDTNLPAINSMNQLDSGNIFNNFRIYYITDIHLERKIVDHFNGIPPETQKTEFIEGLVERSFKKYANQRYNALFLIGGDIANDMATVKSFFTALTKYIQPCQIIYILGNHELWETAHGNLDATVQQYRDLSKEIGIAFAQNDLLLIRSIHDQYIVSEDSLLESSPEDIRKTCSGFPLIMLCGIGFSEYGKLNATSGMYLDCLRTLEEDAEQTERFRRIYVKVRETLSDFPVIIFTHMPVNHWLDPEEYEPGWIYVNGHTHQNYSVDDVTKRVYADNQIGYRRKTLDFHCFDVGCHYDIFRYLSDGIYEINRSQYRNFYHKLGLSLQFNSEGTIYLLKKSGIYCFLYEEDDILFLLDGGRMSALHKPIGYYYANLQQYYDFITATSEPFRKELNEISEFVRSFGGNGNVHGSIVDIDFYDHIFFNPLDGKITAYYATDIVNKYVYPNVAALLEDKQPLLCPGYVKALEGCKLPAIIDDSRGKTASNGPVLVKDTSIYRLSKRAKGFEYMANYNIVRQWVDEAYQKNVDVSAIPEENVAVVSIAEIQPKTKSRLGEFLKPYVRAAVDDTVRWQMDFSDVLSEMGMKVPVKIKVTPVHVGKQAKSYYSIDKWDYLSKGDREKIIKDEIIEVDILRNEESHAYRKSEQI